MGVIREGEASDPRAGGLVWQTQGSGKSLTMVMLAKALAGSFWSSILHC